eukprot:UN32650
MMFFPKSNDDKTDKQKMKDAFAFEKSESDLKLTEVSSEGLTKSQKIYRMFDDEKGKGDSDSSDVPDIPDAKPMELFPTHGDSSSSVCDQDDTDAKMSRVDSSHQLSKPTSSSSAEETDSTAAHEDMDNEESGHPEGFSATGSNLDHRVESDYVSQNGEEENDLKGFHLFAQNSDDTDEDPVERQSSLKTHFSIDESEPSRSSLPIKQPFSPEKELTEKQLKV